MRSLFFLVIVAALGWSGYWWVGASGKRQAIEGWLDQRRAEGWVADVGDLTVTGYPNRFDSFFTDLQLADPGSGWSWSAPSFQIFALSYQPNHIIAVWPETQTLASPLQRITVNSRQMEGSIRFRPSTALALEQSIIALDGVNMVSTLGWAASLSRGQLAVRRAPEGAAPDYGYDVTLTADTLRLPEPVRDRLDPAGLLPAAIATAEIRLTPVFDAPWDRHAVENGPPQLTTLNVGNVSARWGEMELAVTGRLDADAQGYADGRLNVIARNWTEMIDLAVAGGWVSADMGGTLEQGLGFIARMTGDTSRLDVTLTFEDGRMRLGPIPLGDAPRLNAATF
ncbi:DUF2125 domain-containing protein [Halovulum dunhuangense]|uniref:DUF2125 domain-containing protein n=1 Tax=Halovulum dunhuangense TaxID=1505036 RepID=A0A849KZS9_9RHOB|nr:DUF2125 domain-containing protein [Halovulum dunhuangense]NNU79594.1 DUF2125 domain-containing protein [Halovulum dunhuangense]